MTQLTEHGIYRRRTTALLAASAVLPIAPQLAAADGEIALPAPQTAGGKPLMQALKERHSTRSFAAKPLDRQVLSNLLWAAFGINRDDGRRTAPSARNWQEIDIYAMLPDAAYRYDAKANALQRAVAQDLRALAGTQPHAREAPVTLVYVADDARAPGVDEATRGFYSAVDTGVILQNVYLCCASEGLAAIAYASIDRARLAAALQLGPRQHITMAQSIGYPKA